MLLALLKYAPLSVRRWYAIRLLRTHFYRAMAMRGMPTLVQATVLADLSVRLTHRLHALGFVGPALLNPLYATAQRDVGLPVTVPETPLQIPANA